MTNYCTNYRILLLGDNPNKDQRILAYSRCKQWDCEYCARVNRRIWSARLIAGLNNLGGEWTFLTLTARGDNRTPESSLAQLRPAWDKISKRLRKIKTGLEYARIFETHADGVYHLHALINYRWPDAIEYTNKNGSTYWNSAALLEWLEKYDIGYIHDCRPMIFDETHHAGYTAAYVAKYLSKMRSDHSKILGRVRRIVVSSGFPKHMPEKTEYTWLPHVFLYPEDVIGKKAIYDVAEKQIVPEEWFQFYSVYPALESDDDPDEWL